jgi:hypothetical protein
VKKFESHKSDVRCFQSIRGNGIEEGGKEETTNQGESEKPNQENDDWRINKMWEEPRRGEGK